MILRRPCFQRLFPLKSRDTVLDEDKVVEQDKGDVPKDAPGDPSRGHPKPPVPPSRQTGRHPVLHVSYGADWIR